MDVAASPYRVGETPLMVRERGLEQELARTRELLDAFANEEVRVGREVRLRQTPPEHLRAIEENIASLLATEDRVKHELEEVRALLVARGERKKVGARPDALLEGDVRFMLAVIVVALFGPFLFLYLRKADTAEAAPPSASLGWGGPLEPDQTWLYVEGREGAEVTVDGRPFRTPNRVPVSALHSHDVRFEGGGQVVVRWIPCTTALVRSGPPGSDPSVERFYNHSTCF